MSLPRDMVKGLRHELADLVAVRDEATAKIVALEALLRAYGELRDTSVAPEHIMTAGAATLGMFDGERVRLRDAILSVLGSKDRGYKPGELTAELERQGFPAGNAVTPLGARVSSELSRLYREDRIGKDPTGRYKAKRASGSTTPDEHEAGSNGAHPSLPLTADA
jgi:hypothetical protein